MNGNWKYGLRWQAKRDTAFEHSRACDSAAALRSPAQSKADSHRGVEVILASHRHPDSPASEAQCNKCELFVLLSFVVLSFLGLFFCGYVIVAKCRGTWPF
jgi:hypothetical protein